jgi:hypothetical protein
MGVRLKTFPRRFVVSPSEREAVRHALRLKGIVDELISHYLNLVTNDKLTSWPPLYLDLQVASRSLWRLSSDENLIVARSIVPYWESSPLVRNEFLPAYRAAVDEQGLKLLEEAIFLDSWLREWSRLNR